MMPAPLTSYTLQFEITLEASRKKVWRAMTQDIAQWWPAHFNSNSNTKKFVMECKVGGRVYEDWGRKSGGEWGRLIVFQPSEKLIWAGHHFGKGGKGWGHFFVTIILEDLDNGTLLRFEDSGFGMLDAGMRTSLESGWKELYGQHLKEHVESAGQKKLDKKKKK